MTRRMELILEKTHRPKGRDGRRLNQVSRENGKWNMSIVMRIERLAR